jgi:hypothetical protein
MSFADPATITINGVAHSLVRVKVDQYSSEYMIRSSTDEHRMNVRNTSYLDKKRGVTIDRHNVELIQTTYPVAPATLSVIRRAYVVVENQRGDTLTDPLNVAIGLLSFLTASGGSAITKMLNLES